MGNLLTKVSMNALTISNFLANTSYTDNEELDDLIGKLVSVFYSLLTVFMLVVSGIIIVRFIVEAVKLANNGGKPEVKVSFVSACIMMVIALVVAIGAKWFVPALADWFRDIFSAN